MVKSFTRLYGAKFQGTFALEEKSKHLKWGLMLYINPIGVIIHETVNVTDVIQFCSAWYVDETVIDSSVWGPIVAANTMRYWSCLFWLNLVCNVLFYSC